MRYMMQSVLFVWVFLTVLLILFASFAATRVKGRGVFLICTVMFLPMEKSECFFCLGPSVHTYTMRRSLERLHCLLKWIEVLLLLLFCYYTNRVLQWPSKAVGGEGGFTFVPSFKFLCSDQTYLTQCYVGILCEPLYIWLCIYTIIVNVNGVSFPSFPFLHLSTMETHFYSAFELTAVTPLCVWCKLSLSQPWN